MKCPFCKSENTERISGNTVITKQIPEKTSKQGNVTCTESAYTMSFGTKRYICFNGDFFFEKLGGGGSGFIEIGGCRLDKKL